MTKVNSYWMNEEEYELVTNLTPIPTVNLIILRGIGENLEVLLLIRKTGYAKGRWCIIGGRVMLGEVLKEAINRHAADLGVKVRIIPPFEHNFPCYIDDRINQDKTKQPCSLIYPVEIISGEVREEGEEYRGYKWFLVNDLPKIAYRQKLQIQKAVEQLEKFKKSD